MVVVVVVVVVTLYGVVVGDGEQNITFYLSECLTVFLSL